MCREPRRKKAALLVAIGVPDQHALSASVRFEMAPIQGIRQEFLHRLATTLESAERLELWSNIKCNLARMLVIRLSPASKQKCGKHVVRGRRAAHDEIPH